MYRSPDNRSEQTALEKKARLHRMRAFHCTEQGPAADKEQTNQANAAQQKSKRRQLLYCQQ